MARTRTQYVCQECGHTSAKWLGQCPACNEWNTLVAEAAPRVTARAHTPVVPAESLADIPADGESHRPTGIAELDRILGGGIVRGQVILVGGDPGIGKSTLLLQAADALTRANTPVLYVSGEESPAQTKLRAQRLGMAGSSVLLMSETELPAILDEAGRRNPALVVVDSIQVMSDGETPSAPGSVAQVRECAASLVRYAKKTNTSVIIVGHVTKTGAIAGPRVVEHLVDTVLYFEGERHNVYRILRAVKNRFGSTDEIGVFEMTGQGLQDVPNPSALFLAQRSVQRSGSAVGAALEGSRPLLLEVQALVATSPFGTPVRRAVGIDQNRVTLLLAVLEKRLSLRLQTQDVFVSLAGGLRATEPALDLACLAAVASSFYDRPVSEQCVVMGEVGLGGEVRAVSQVERRVMEAKRLGFSECVLPAHNLKTFREKGTAELTWQGMHLVGCEDVAAALRAVVGADASVGEQ
jgi:DNA repair protein RadA/Sms